MLFCEPLRQTSVFFFLLVICFWNLSSVCVCVCVWPRTLWYKYLDVNLPTNMSAQPEAFRSGGSLPSAVSMSWVVLCAQWVRFHLENRAGARNLRRCLSLWKEPWGNNLGAELQESGLTHPHTGCVPWHRLPISPLPASGHSHSILCLYSLPTLDCSCKWNQALFALQ